MLAFVRNQRGAVLAIVAVSMVILLGMVGLAVDGGNLYWNDSQLSRAVDAGALGAAGALRLGQSMALQRATSLAAANGVDPGSHGDETLSINFGTNSFGEATVTVTATRVVPMYFMRVLGHNQATVSAVAEATVPPLDIVFLIDQSGSLGDNGAWDDLQIAAKNFVDKFDDNLDQMGLVSYQIRGTDRFALGAPFRNSIKNKIDLMQSAGDTNTGEGLRLARLQIENGPVRDRSVKVVVLFTDGRPTAFRDNLGSTCADCVMAVCTTPCNIRGAWNDPDNLPTDAIATNPPRCQGYPSSCYGRNEPQARDEARQSGIVRANEIRADGIYIFAIGLGNPNAGNALLVPDNNYMKLLANVDGAADPSQPQGGYYFAPSPAELNAVFEQLAQDIVVRLTQ